MKNGKSIIIGNEMVSTLKSDSIYNADNKVPVMLKPRLNKP